MDIKVGDTVKAIDNGCGYRSGRLYTVARFTRSYSSRFIDVIDQETGEVVVGCYTCNFEKVEPPKHEGKILIMVDKEDNNKIIARDLITGKTSEAKRNPKDKWDFNKGAKLALERLTEPEKPKGWTGKVVCVCNNVGDKYDCFHNDDFVVGKVYTVKDGYIISEQRIEYTGIALIVSPKQLSWTDESPIFDCPYRCKFIEYKGGAEE